MNRRSFLIGFGALITGATVLGSERKWWQVPGDRVLRPTLSEVHDHLRHEMHVDYVTVLYGGAAGGGKIRDLRDLADSPAMREWLGPKAGAELYADAYNLRDINPGGEPAIVPSIQDTYDVIPVRDLRADEAVRWVNEPGISPQERARRKTLTFGVRLPPSGMSVQALRAYLDSMRTSG